MPKRGDEGFNEKLLGFNYLSDRSLWNDERHRRAAMACLVVGVTRMERNRLDKEKDVEESNGASIWWRTFGYRVEKRIMDFEKKKGSIFGAVYVRMDGGGEAPPVVVAFRGTMVKNVVDLAADFKILWHNLCSHNRFRVASEEVTRQVAAAHGGAASVCVAGHSKGAAIALLVARQCAETLIHDQSSHSSSQSSSPASISKSTSTATWRFLEAHLFNPPNPTPCIENPLTPISPVPKRVTDTLLFTHNAVAKLISKVLQDHNTRHYTKSQFRSIAEWYPHLYVHPRDPICSGYITYFQARDRLPRFLKDYLKSHIDPTPNSIRSILHSQFTSCVGDPRPHHLIPSAYLHINTSKPSHYFNLESHGLCLWYDLDTVIDTHQHNLLGLELT